MPTKKGSAGERADGPCSSQKDPDLETSGQGRWGARQEPDNRRSDARFVHQSRPLGQPPLPKHPGNCPQDTGNLHKFECKRNQGIQVVPLLNSTAGERKP